MRTKGKGGKRRGRGRGNAATCTIVSHFSRCIKKKKKKKCPYNKKEKWSTTSTFRHIIIIAVHLIHSRGEQGEGGGEIRPREFVTSLKAQEMNAQK